MQKKVQRGVIYLLTSFANSLAWICLQQKLYSEAAIPLRKMSTVAFLQNISVNCRHCNYKCIENTIIFFFSPCWFNPYSTNPLPCFIFSVKPKEVALKNEKAYSHIPDNCYGHHGRCPCKNILSGVKFSRLNTKTAYIKFFRDIFECFEAFLVYFWV